MRAISFLEEACVTRSALLWTRRLVASLTALALPNLDEAGMSSDPIACSMRPLAALA